MQDLNLIGIAVRYFCILLTFCPNRRDPCAIILELLHRFSAVCFHHRHRVNHTTLSFLAPDGVTEGSNQFIHFTKHA